MRPVEQRSDFHKTFLLAERRAILHRWVADQVALLNDASAAFDRVPLVGYSSEFLDRFLEDVGEGGSVRCQDWIRSMIDDSVLAELTPVSVSSFLVALRTAIHSLWTMEAWSRHSTLATGGGDSLDQAMPIFDMVAVVETTGHLDSVLLAGLKHLERHRKGEMSIEVDSLELMEQRQRMRDLEARFAAPASPTLEDELDQLDSVSITLEGPLRPPSSIRGMAGHLRAFEPHEDAAGPSEEKPAEEAAHLDLAARMMAARKAGDAPPEPAPGREGGPFDPRSDDFLARISHEFRSPLSSILSVCNMCASGKEGLLGGEEGGEAFSIIERSARQLLHLTENLMHMRRLESGTTQEATVRLQMLADDLVATFDPLARRKGLNLRVDVPAGLPDLRTDSESLMAILRNLMANAVSYTERGSVELWAMVDPDDASGRTLVLGVSDTGPGIAKDHQERIFEPFWRGPGASVSDTRGTGLGLSIVREALRRVGGEIAVQSEGGQGTTFVVALPDVLELS